MDSFLNCCADLDRIGRWLCIDDGSTAADRARMAQRYPFLEFIEKTEAEKGHVGSMERLRQEVTSAWWLPLEDDWHFVVPGRYVGRALDVLDADPRIGQVLFNRNYGEVMGDRQLAGGEVDRTATGRRFRRHVHHPPGTSAYEAYLATLGPDARTNTWWPHFSLRPSLLRTTALTEVGPFTAEADNFELEYAERYSAAGWSSAFFDQIQAVRLGPRTFDRGPDRALSAYDLNGRPQFGEAPSPSSGAAGPGRPPIHVVIPVRDQWPYTRSIVGQVLAEPVASLTVIDNGSTDGTPDRLAAIDDPRLRVLHRPGANLHAMWNEGWQMALPGPAAVAILNNDLVLAPDTLTRMRDALYADDDLWVVYPDHRRAVGEGDGYVGSVTRTEGTFASGGMSGFCFMLRAEAHNEGLPLVDEGFEWWFGDDDLARNVVRAGRRIGRLDQLPVDHVGEASAKSHDLSAAKERDRLRWVAKVADRS